MLVVDASVLAPTVADSGADGTRFRDRLRGEALGAPDLARIEVGSMLRRQAHRGLLTVEQAEGALDDLLDGELLVGVVGHQLEGGVEEALHAGLGPHPGGVEGTGHRLLSPGGRAPAAGPLDRLVRAHGGRR